MGVSNTTTVKRILTLAIIAPLPFLLYQFLGGIIEGMVMYFPNVRDHPWFHWYHFLSVAEALTLILTTWVFLATIRKLDPLIIVGAGIIAWELFEIGYIIGRLGQVDLTHENIFGVYTVDGPQVIAVHTARIIAGLVIWISMTIHNTTHATPETETPTT